MVGLKDIRALAKLMESYGMTYLKTTEIEVHRNPAPKAPPTGQATPSTPEMVPVDAPTEELGPIADKTVEMTSLLKLSDTDLIDRLFPEPREEAG